MSRSLSLTSARRIPTTARGPRIGIWVAVLLHAAIVAATLFSWQHTLEIADRTPPVVPVDLVTPGDTTNVTPMVQHDEPKPAEPTPPPPQPAPEPPTPAPTPPSQAEAAPEPVPSQPVVPKAAPLPKPTIKPAPTPAPAPAKPKPKADDVDALINALSKPVAVPRNAKPSTRTVAGVGAMNAMTADLQDSLRSQISPCWSPPTGVPHLEQLRPAFRFQLNRDGTVVGMPQLTSDSAAAAAGNPYMRAAAEAGRRAIMACQPYKLPAEKYDIWRDITSLDFDPSKMVQQ